MKKLGEIIKRLSYFYIDTATSNKFYSPCHVTTNTQNQDKAGIGGLPHLHGFDVAVIPLPALRLVLSNNLKNSDK